MNYTPTAYVYMFKYHTSICSLAIPSPIKIESGARLAIGTLCCMVRNNKGTAQRVNCTYTEHDIAELYISQRDH